MQHPSSQKKSYLKICATHKLSGKRKKQFSTKINRQQLVTNFVLLQAFLELVKALLLGESPQPQPSAYSARYITPRTVTTVARRQVVAGFEFPPTQQLNVEWKDWGEGPQSARWTGWPDSARGNPTDTRHGVKIKFTFEKRSGTYTNQVSWLRRLTKVMTWELGERVEGR